MPKKAGILLAAALLLSGPWLVAQFDEMRMLPLDDPAIGYSKGQVRNSASALQSKIRSGEIKLKSDFDHGYLEAVLKALNVPVSSQLLEFSKTSLQSSKIGPRMPRAIYHTDDVSVAWVRGGDAIEIAAVDARQGVVFYTLDQGDSGTPIMARRNDCLQCHNSPVTLGVPGLVVRSTHVDRSGAQLLDARAYITDHRTPFEHRWGGWYVTGLTGRQMHMGNQFVENPADADEMYLDDGSNVTDLKRYFDTGAYLRPDSDIVSLMVLEHQTRLVNLIARLGWESRLGMETAPTVEELVKYLLFVDETPLKSPIEGYSEFAREFSKQGPHDRQGRSLRDFDLKTRMFRYPCSFLIYSAQFDGLPPEALAKVYGRLHDVLTGKDSSPSFARLTAADRKEILEILLATKTGLPEGWKAGRG
jgi:hypothetical protein